MPAVAELAATPDARHGPDASLLDPDPLHGRVGRTLADGVAAVSVEERGVVAVEFRALLPQDVDRNADTVPGDGPLADDLGVAEVDRGRPRQRRRRDLP